MNNSWQMLAGNLATVALMISIWMHLSYRLQKLSSLSLKIGLGITLGLSAVASMLLSIQFEPGVFFDLRPAIVGAAAIFGGPVPLAITAGITIAFRLFLGGVGAVPGVAVIVVIALTGTVTWYLAGKRPVDRVLHIIAVTVVATTFTLLVPVVFLPDLLSRIIGKFAMLIVVVNFMTMAATGFILAYFRRFTLERDVLYAALTQAPDYHYVKDVDHRFVVTNLNVARYNGRENAAGMVGLTDFDLTPEPRATQLQDAERQVLETGIPLENFEEYIVEDGKEPRWYSTSKVPLRDRHGGLIGLAGVTFDVTERKKLENELRASRNVMSRAMEEMSDGLAMFDADGCLVFCNDQYRALFPRSASARKKGAHISDILRAVIQSAERRDLPVDMDEEAILNASGTLYTNKDEVIPQSDGRWLSLRTRVAEDRTVLVLVTDVTAMKEAEQSLMQFADRMKNLAQTDSLTGLANRRSFDETLVVEFVRARKTGCPMALLLVDIDRFKSYNDTYGHLAGDDCLKQVAQAMVSLPGDAARLVARFGGEEFAILLTDTDAATAIAAADRLRAHIRNLGLVHQGSESGFVTASVGVAVVSSMSTFNEPVELISQADTALYHSKSAGRDRTVFMAQGNDGSPVNILVSN